MATSLIFFLQKSLKVVTMKDIVMNTGLSKRAFMKNKTIGLSNFVYKEEKFKR